MTWYVLFVQQTSDWKPECSTFTGDSGGGDVLVGRYDVFGQAQYAALCAEKTLQKQLGRGACVVLPVPDEEQLLIVYPPRLSMATRHTDPWLEEELARYRMQHRANGEEAC